MPQLPPLEQFPYGPRRTLQKIFADKDLRDVGIAALEKEIGRAAAWSAELRIDALSSGEMKVTFYGRPGPRASRRSKAS